MGFHPPVLHNKTQEKQSPLVMDRLHHHVIDIATTNSVSTNSSSDDHVNHEGPHHNVDRPSSSRSEIHLSEVSSSSTTRLNSGNSSFSDRGDAFGYTSPLHSGLWILVELIVTLAQIVASVVILSLSRYRSSEAPLFAWVIGYACGCLATLPILYWRLRNGRNGFRRHSVQSHRSSSQAVNSSSVSLVQEEDESRNNSHVAIRSSQTRGRINVRVNGFIDHFKMALDCFFAVWFVVGNVWIFGAHSSPSVAPKLYRLCIVFLTFSCIGYALPFLLCATIFCCLPCIISVMGIREDLSKTRGATTESINALPTYKCTLLKNENIGDEVIHLSSSKSGASTLEERTISHEDAVCCICLAPYMDNDELRELPCSHLFHTACVDKWLKINASCPLCKVEVTESNEASSSVSL